MFAQVRLRRQLTADWRSSNQDKLEPSHVVLNRLREMKIEALEATVPVGSRRPIKVKTDAAESSRINCAQSSSSPLPYGWAFIPFSLLAKTIKNGISKKPSETGSLKIFRISAVRPMEFDLTDWRLTEDDPAYNEYRLRKGDLVFTRYNGSRGYVGVAAVYDGDESHVYPDKLIRCQIASDIADPGYLAKAVSCGESRRFVESRIRTTAGQAGISGADVRTIPVPLCPIDEQILMNCRLDARFSEVSRFEAEIEAGLEKARLMRQSILKQAFSGQLVPHDSDDEPASALLQRIQSERAAAFVRQKKAKLRTNGEVA